MALLATVLALTVSTAYAKMGDVDCSETMPDARDALLLLQYDVGYLDSLPCFENGDANGDGTINVLDARAVLHLVFNVESNPPRVLPTLIPPVRATPGGGALMSSG